MKKTDGEMETAIARRRLGDERLLKFLRACKNCKEIHACEFVNEDLDKGKSLDDIFYTGEEYGYFLEVREGKGGTFHISFGYAAPPTAGDGGTWRVQFNSDGEIIAMRLKDGWIF